MTKSDRLREARKGAGFTKSASDAARALGVKEPTYLAHENGSRDFDDDSAAVYARRFGVRPEWLIYGTGQKKAAHQFAEDAPSLSTGHSGTPTGQNNSPGDNQLTPEQALEKAKELYQYSPASIDLLFEIVRSIQQQVGLRDKKS